MSASTELVLILMTAERPIALHEAQSRIREIYGSCHETTALSARIRSGAKDYAARIGFVIKSKRAPNSAKHLYWLERV
ncbi:MAG TPA: hypothetical protein PK129_01905 [Cellvibrionaceae bacterium]|nr:hypothetical protein [Cellvibrionaceae bacterium]